MFTECAQIVTEEFQERVTADGRVARQLTREDFHYDMFEPISPGGLEGQLLCQWGFGPDVATDDLIDLGWAPLTGDAVEQAKQKLVAAGYDRIATDGGEYFAIYYGDDGQSVHQPVDEDGYGVGDTYLFTGTDVRWAFYLDAHDFLRPPTG